MRRSWVWIAIAIFALAAIGAILFQMREATEVEPPEPIVSPEPLGSAAPSDSPLPEPSPSWTGEAYDSAENPREPTPAWRRLDDEFARIPSRLPLLKETSKRLPRLPFLIDGCEGESCGFVRDLTLTCDAAFRSDPHPKGHFAFSLPKGTTLEKARVFTLVKKLGRARLRREKKSLTVLSFSSEGDWLIWEDGELGSWSEWRDGGARSFRRPVREAWILAEDDEGRIGWLKLDAPSDAINQSKCPFVWGL